MDDLIERMENTDFSSPAWPGQAKKLQEMALYHFKDGESQFFISVGQKLGSDEKTRLGKAYRREMTRLKS